MFKTKGKIAWIFVKPVMLGTLELNDVLVWIYTNTTSCLV